GPDRRVGSAVTGRRRASTRRTRFRPRIGRRARRESGRTMGGEDAGKGATEGRAEIRQRLRATAPGAVQGRDLRLEGLPARRRAAALSLAPTPAALPALQIVLQPASGTGDSRTIVDMDLRPANLTWHPTGTLIAFTADADFRDELKYDHPDLWTATTDGKVTR